MTITEPELTGDGNIPSTSAIIDNDTQMASTRNTRTPTYLYFNADPIPHDKQVAACFSGTISRSHRRDHWLTERRAEQRLAVKNAVVQQRLKARTEKLAAHWTNDPLLTTGRRLAARTRSEIRKPSGKLYTSIKSQYVKPTLFTPASPTTTTTSTGTTTKYHPILAPSKSNRAGSLSTVPALASLRTALPNSTLFNWSDMTVSHSATWKFQGQSYTAAELFAALSQRIALAEAYKRLHDAEHKVFQRSMRAATKLLHDCYGAARGGVNVDGTTLWQVLAPLPRKRALKPKRSLGPVPGWRRGSVVNFALENLRREEERRVARGEVPMGGEEEEWMEVDALNGWPIVDGAIIAPHYAHWRGGWLDLNGVSVEDFNTETMANCGELCRTMNVDQLRFLRDHLAKLKEQGREHVSKEKWSALNKEVAMREKQHRNKWGKQGQGDAWGRKERDGDTKMFDRQETVDRMMDWEARGSGKQSWFDKNQGENHNHRDKGDRSQDQNQNQRGRGKGRGRGRNGKHQHNDNKQRNGSQGKSGQQNDRKNSGGNNKHHNDKGVHKGNGRGDGNGNGRGNRYRDGQAGGRGNSGRGRGRGGGRGRGRGRGS